MQGNYSSSVIITRPFRDAKKTAKRVLTLGFTPICIPLMEIQHVYVRDFVQAVEDADNIVISSENGMRGFIANCDSNMYAADHGRQINMIELLKGKNLYFVGKQSLQLYSRFINRGDIFSQVLCFDRASALRNHILQYGQRNESYLQIAGDVVRYDIADLVAHGFNRVRRIIVYSVRSLDGRSLCKYKNGIFLVYSARANMLLCDAMEYCEGATYIYISAGAANIECAEGADVEAADNAEKLREVCEKSAQNRKMYGSWCAKNIGNRLIADTPDEDGMMKQLNMLR